MSTEPGSADLHAWSPPEASPPVAVTEKAAALAVILPAFNEQANLRTVLPPLLEEARRRNWDVIVVNDGSADESASIAQQLGATVLSHPRNRGYGAALKTGIQFASTPLVATMDADGQHTIEALTAVTDRMAESDADAVIGARSGIRQSPLWRMPGKWILTRLSEFIAGEHIPDLNSGLRVFRRDVIQRYLHLCPDGFSFSTTSTLALLDRGRRIDYVPIDVHPRQGRSTVSVATGFATILLILRLATLFEPLRLFTLAAFVFSAVGVLWSIPYAISGRGVSLGSALLILAAVQLLFVGLLADQVASLRKERFE